MKSKTLIYYLALGFLILGIFMGEVDARRKILRGRKTITRHYYRGLGVPAWSVVVLCGLGMLAAGGGLYALLHKTIVSGSNNNDTRSYHPAMQDDV